MSLGFAHARRRWTEETSSSLIFVVLSKGSDSCLAGRRDDLTAASRATAPAREKLTG